MYTSICLLCLVPPPLPHPPPTTQMARVQHELKGYMQKLVMLVGTKEPYFTVLCGMLDLLPPDPHRLPVREDDFLAQIQTRINQRGGGGGGGGVAAAGGISSGGGGVGGRGVGRVNGGNPAKPASKQGSLPPKGAASSLRRQSYGDYGGYGNGSERLRSIGSTASAKRKDRLSSGSAGGQQQQRQHGVGVGGSSASTSAS